jgi:hypothetical protein
LPVKNFSAEQQREIVFKDMDTLDVSHTTVLDSVLSPTHQAAVGFFANSILRDLKLVGGFDALFGKLKDFMETALFERAVDLDDLNVLRNLSEPAVTKAVLETFKLAINALTVSDKGTTEIRDSIKLSRIRPFVVNDQPYAVAGNSIFNKVVCDNGFELELAELLARSKQIISFAKIPERKTGAFNVEYQSSDGGISNYYPDFVVKQTDSDIWLVETKGREDLNDPRKWKRLKQYCADATEKDPGGRKFRALFIRQEQWEKYRPKTFESLCETFADAEDDGNEKPIMAAELKLAEPKEGGVRGGVRVWGLVVHSPYAQEIASGKKRIEHRSWNTNYRGWIAIIAARRPESGDDAGRVVCLVQLTNCVQAAAKDFEWELSGPISLRERVDLPGRLGLYDVTDQLPGWVLGKLQGR